MDADLRTAFLVTGIGHQRRKYVAAHVDPDCFQLSRVGVTIPVPPGFETYFSCCSNCVRAGRWYAADAAPPEFYRWWASAKARVREVRHVRP